MKRFHLYWLFPILLVTLGACSGLPFQLKNTAHSRTFLSDFSTTWAAVLNAISSMPSITQNRDLGTVSTGWVTKTNSWNFLESFSAEYHAHRARYRIFISVIKGKQGDSPITTVRIQKEQQIAKSIFTRWENINSKGTEEVVYLYRIGRLIALENYLNKQNEENIKNISL